MCEHFISDSSENIAKSIDDIQAAIQDKTELLKAILYSEPNDSVIRCETTGSLRDDMIKLARLYKNKIKMEESYGGETENDHN